MDVTALLVFVSGFVVCAGVVFLLSSFGAKEETFEEALAKQRRANEKEKKSNKEKKKENDSSNKKSKNWRMKKKGERDDKQDGMDEAEEEQLVVVPAGAKVEDVVEAVPEKVKEEVAPVEVKQVSKKEKKKKTMDIQEVEVVPEPVEAVEEPAPVPEEKVAVVEVKEVPASIAVETVKNTKSSPSKQKTKKEKPVPTEVAAPAAPTSPKELLSIVKKTAFNDTEAQKLIDVLLTKQSGDSLNASDEWIEKGKPTETQKLKQELSETIHYLEDEKMKVKSFGDKLTVMRKELNDEKSAKANHNRIIDEIQKARGLEVSAINNRLQQVVADNNLLQNNLQQEVAIRRNLEQNHSQYQLSIDNLNSQVEMAKMAANQAKAADPHFMVELEQLRTLRDKYENSLAEINVNNSNLKNQISQQGEEISSMKNQLNSSSDKVSQLTKSNTSLEQALAAKAEEAQKASVEISSLKSKKPQEAILNNNNINIAAIESELASVKQKLVEKEKETARLAQENERLGEQVASALERPAEMVNGHAEDASASDSDQWKEKFEQLTREHEKMLAEQKVLQADFDKEVSSVKGQVDGLKSKNNDLSRSLESEKKSSETVLLRLFPSLSGKTDLEAEAQEALEAMAKGEAHYKNVLAQTDSMLTSLQASVETAEAEWRLKLEAANKELSEMRAQKSSPQPHISTNQMQEQLSDLQKKLAKEEEERTSVAKLNKELDKEVENLSQQLSESRRELEEESGKVKELVMTNNSLKDLVTNTQEALDKEQNIVKSYKETTPNGKVENGGSIGTPEVGSGSNSKLSIPPSVSTPSIASIDSTTNTSPEKKKKSKKKKLLGLFKSSS